MVRLGAKINEQNTQQLRITTINGPVGSRKKLLAQPPSTVAKMPKDALMKIICDI